MAPRPDREPDEWDRLAQLNRDPTPPPTAGVAFPAVARLVEREYGAGWWHNPARWDTLDGYAPYGAVWAAWETMRRARALERLSLIRAIAIARAGEAGQRAMDSDMREAFPDGEWPQG